MYTVYKLTTPSEKVYIGITGQKPERRWQNGNGYRKNKHLYSAILKYGWDNIEHEIICQAPMSAAQAGAVEKSFIALYDSTNPDKGYNHSIGGEYGALGMHHSAESRAKMSKGHKGKTPWNKGKTGQISWNKGKHLSAETRKKLSEAHKNPSAETRQKISEAGKGRAPWNKGKKGEYHHCDDTHRIMSEAHRGKTAKAVVCVETGIVYSSGTEAAKSIGVAQQSISDVVRGARKTAGGYHWKYAD